MKNFQEMIESEIASQVEARTSTVFAQARSKAQELLALLGGAGDAAVAKVAEVVSVIGEAAFSYAKEVQACLRGSTVHFQAGGYKNYDKGDIMDAPKDVLGSISAALEAGEDVGRSFYGSLTRYVKIKPVSQTAGRLPDGTLIPLPANLLR